MLPPPFLFFFAINALGLEHYGHLGLIGVYVLTIGVVINWSMYTNCEDSGERMMYSLEAEVMTVKLAINEYRALLRHLVICLHFGCLEIEAMDTHICLLQASLPDVLLSTMYICFTTT